MNAQKSKFSQSVDNIPQMRNLIIQKVSNLNFIRGQNRGDSDEGQTFRDYHYAFEDGFNGIRQRGDCGRLNKSYDVRGVREEKREMCDDCNNEDLGKSDVNTKFNLKESEQYLKYLNDQSKKLAKEDNSYIYELSENMCKNTYESPIITKIARQNYITHNPYTSKKVDLGLSSLKNNPILYPINSYKFDLRKYIENKGSHSMTDLYHFN